MRFARILSFLLFLTLFSGQSHAEAPKFVEARLFSPVTATGKADVVNLALELKLQPKWDTYWRTPGDAGLPPDLDFKGSENLKGFNLQYPVPHRLTVSGLDNNVYVDQVTFPLAVTLETPGAPLNVKLKLSLLVCNEICVPEKHELTFTLPAGEAMPSTDAALYDAALEKLPRTVMEGHSFTSSRLETGADQKTVLVIEAQMAGEPSPEADLFVEHESGTAFGKPAITFDAGSGKTVFRIEPHTSETPEKLAKDLGSSEITLTFVDKGIGFEGKMQLNAAPDTAPKPMSAPAKLKEKITSLDIGILLGALLGGLILNLMPCVLPVLSLKVLSVVSHGGKDSRGKIFKNFMASALGVLVSFWIMAGALVAAKAAGSTIGWGIQFQHPGFLIFLIAVLLLFAVNMWGLFEIPLPRFIAKHATAKHENEPTLTGHFLTGAFAALLATPCTAPFLGTAVGFALSRGAYEIFLIFTFLGLGLALPYIALAVSPRVFKLMPKPGKWMITLRKVLAVILLATAVWLGSVLFRVSAEPALDAGWQQFDAALIAPAVNEGKTVMVDVTADWCLTCKANKKFVLEQDDVKAALNAPNILLLQADYTQQDDVTAQYLGTFGRYGIPFNVVYGPAAPEGIVLPELLTKKAVVDALNAAAGE
ncbi:MAG: protein-disulfide reductase DsbD family protein [bacterium]|nr:protein-disulfide reductase DsbD family protein [bacterium]